jgi:hypothetical protein
MSNDEVCIFLIVVYPSIFFQPPTISFVFTRSTCKSLGRLYISGYCSGSNYCCYNNAIKCDAGQAGYCGILKMFLPFFVLFNDELLHRNFSRFRLAYLHELFALRVLVRLCGWKM